MTDERFGQCMVSMRKGDRNALKEVYEEYMPYVYKTVYAVLQSREDAEDISCEVFLRLWDTAERFREGSPHRAYIATIARNMAIDHLRKRKREVFAEEDESGQTVLDTAGSEEAEIEDSVIGNISVREALDSLGEPDRTIISMKVLAEMTFKDIAEAIGMAMGTVTWKYREAVKKLRRYGFDEGL